MNIPLVVMRDKYCAVRVSSLINEEPLRIVEACVNVMWEVVGKDCRNGSDCVVGKGKTSLCCGGNRDVS